MRSRLRRLLRVAALLAFLFLVPGALVLTAVVYGVLKAIASADPDWHPAPMVIAWARVWTLVYRVPFSMALAILHNEGASVARKLTSRELAALGFDDGDETPYYPPGDIGNPNAPSVGPGQVERVNVLRLWNEGDSAWLRVRRKSFADLARVGEERASLWVAVKMMREELLTANGDELQAIRRYNGSGPAAEAYAARAQSFLDKLPDTGETDNADPA